MTEGSLNKLIINRLKDLPQSSGCYLFKDRNDELLYVGKSKKLKSRVQSYFRSGELLSPRIRLMVRQVNDIEFIITDTEAEALTLESNLIKEYQPHFNILLKDDKKYPYLCITWSETYPRIFITRRRRNRNPKDRYYGPYVDVTLLRRTLFLIKKVFPVRQRNKPLFSNRTCLNYNIGRCPGVCQELINEDQYKQTISRIAMVFQGRIEELKNLLIQQMKNYSNKQEYERAAALRDQINGLKQLTQEQKMIIPDSSVNRDVFAMSNNNNLACIQLFQMRAGKLCGRLGFTADYNQCDSNSILETIIEQYYSQVEPIEIPKEILIDRDIPKTSILEDWLSELKSSKVSIQFPRRSQKSDLVKLVSKNSKIEMDRLEKGQKDNFIALDDIADFMELNTIPRRIEAYDISHIQGTNVVASQAVFINGIPAKQHYRRYKIKSSSISPGHSDDYMALTEVIRRRFRKWSELKRNGIDINLVNNANKSTLHTQGLNDWPDLVLIDGGKGQLSSVNNVLKILNLENELVLCSLAKRNEEIFIPNNTKPLSLTKNQPGLMLLMRLRDEAHRFAVKYHRELRSKAISRSRLNDIPGVGSHIIKLLLNHFRSIEAIQLASIDQMKKVSGLGEKRAQQIWKYFHDTEDDYS